MQNALLWAAAGTGFTFLMTTIGAASVFFFRKKTSQLTTQIFLGFAAGVMIAASVWSLLIPAIDSASEAGQIAWIPAAGGFAIGVAFLMILHEVLPHLHPGQSKPEGRPCNWERTTLLFTAVTLHNIPEGMSVGLLFALAAQTGDQGMFGMAIALALGMGIQNLPEGAAVALPLKQGGMSSFKAFLFGALSGAVEPVFGIAVVLIAALIQPYMPWMLAFAAGAMMYVVVEELIPEAHIGKKSSTWGTIAVLIGFLLMMVLDVALG